MSLPESFNALQGQEPGKPPKFVSVPLSKLGPNQVLVKIAFVPINPSDVLTVAGTYVSGGTVGRPIGLEGSGVVVAVGENLKVPHKVGDRVHLTGPGTWAQYIVSNSETVSPVQQEKLSLEEAASHFVNPMTVHHMGYTIKQGGHKAVVHTAGSSALGKMLIRYLKSLGIKSINIVRRDDYTEELKKEGADYVLNSQKPDFDQQLKEVMQKEEANIVFDAIGGDFPTRIGTAAPSGSVIYVYGDLSGKGTATMSTWDLMAKKDLKGFSLYNYIEHLQKSGEFVKAVTEVHSLLDTVFRSEVHKVFKLEEVNEALAYYKDNSSKGKILIQPN